MKYNDIVEGIFIERPNRFIAYVMIAGVQETVHVKNTGRCKELLLPGVTVYLEKSSNPERKTKGVLKIACHTEARPHLNYLKIILS